MHSLLIMIVIMLKSIRGYKPILRIQPDIYHNSFVRKSYKSTYAQETVLEERVLEKLRELKINPTSTLLLSISGGSDSMAMLYIFKYIQINCWRDLNLKVIHFNHKARIESDEEAEFVKDCARKFEMDVFSFEFPPQLRTSNFQASARSWRREQSQRLLDSFPSIHKYILTAHHKEDQVETILMKLLRGAHISHLYGMQDLEGQVLRPLLNFRKEELRQYLLDRNYEWREDLSNQKRIYKRNKIRLDLVPLLTELTGSSTALESRLLSLSRQSHDLDSFVRSQLQQKSHLYQFYRSSDVHIMHFENEINNIPRFLLTQIISVWVKTSIDLQLDTFLIDAAMELLSNVHSGKRSKALTISKTKDFVSVGNELRITNRTNTKDHNKEVELYVGNQVMITGDPSVFEIRAVDSSHQAKDECDLFISPNQTYVVRYVRDGDRVESESRELKVTEFFRRHSIPVHERDRVIGIFSLQDAALATSLIFMQKTDFADQNRNLLIYQSRKEEDALSLRFKWIGKPEKVVIFETTE